MTGTLEGALKGAIFGAISAGLAQGIGNWAGDTFFSGNLNAGHSASFFTEGSFGPALAKAAMHGISRGIITVAQGGKFGAGFVSGFITSGFSVGKTAFSNLVKETAVMARTAVMAMVGGVSSVITGGKFANGAITGAFVHLFNSEGDFIRGVKKGFNDIVDAFVAPAKAAYAYGDFLGRSTGFRDWQNGNVLPWNKWEAQVEYQAFEYGLTNHKLDILQAIGNDMLARPNYYIATFGMGVAINAVSIPTNIGVNYIIKIPGAGSDYIHTEINPLH